MSSFVMTNTNPINIGLSGDASNQAKKNLINSTFQAGISPPKVNPGPSTFVQKQTINPSYITKSFNVGKKATGVGGQLGDQKRERIASNRQLVMLQEQNVQNAEDDIQKKFEDKKKTSKVRNSILINNPKKQLKDLNIPNAFDQLMIRRETIRSRATKPNNEKSTEMIENIFSKEGRTSSKLKSKQNLNLLQNTSNYVDTKESEKKKDVIKPLNKGDLISRFKANSQSAKGKPKGCLSFLSCFTSK